MWLSGAGDGPMGRTPAWVWLALVLTVALTVAVRVRLLDVPLDRDEGEYAYVGQLLLEGVPPYAWAYNMKMPGIYAAYAGILAVFGHTPAGVHAGLLTANLAAIVLVFFLGRRLFGAAVGVVAAATFAVLTLNPRLYGLAGYAEHIVIVPVIAGALVLLHAVTGGRARDFFVAGLSFGLAFVVKQNAAAFAVFAVLWVALDRLRHRQDRRTGWHAVLATAGAIVLPSVIVCLALVASGTFRRFWFWTFTYGMTYALTPSLGDGVVNLVRMSSAVIPSVWLIPVSAIVGLVALLGDERWRSARAFLGLFAVFAFLAAATGLYFRPHYFILLAPAIALLAGLAPDAVARRLPGPSTARNAAWILLAVLPLVHALATERTVLFRVAPEMVPRAVYGADPFVESIEIGRYLRRHATDRDTIAVIGSEPQIYFYARRPAATGFIYMYALMEDQPYASEMQRQLIAELVSARPTFLVLVNVYTSWLAGPRSDTTLARWFDGYGRDFERVGIVDLLEPGPSVYRWDDDSRGYVPRSPHWIAVFRRKQGHP